MSIAARDRLILALDLPTLDDAEAMIERTRGAVGVYKVGYQLAFAGGLALAERLAREGTPVFLDMKLHDIGVDGLVCSPEEAARLRAIVGLDTLLVTPGIRPAGADAGDQKRIMTPGEAILAGADYLVVGRPIVKAADPAAAASAIVAEIDRAIARRKAS
jgi:orotidine-5'-phosphate decarboxylase